MNNFIKKIVLFGIFILLLQTKAYALWNIDLETGYVFNDYNFARIPNEGGTKISLSQELNIDPAIFYRVKFDYCFRKNKKISLLIAPLSLDAEGRIDKNVSFNGVEFSSNTDLKAKYRFDSYRITYQYSFPKTRYFQLGIGFTGKIRDAAISLEGDRKKTQKTNTGFVPLFNFKIDYFINNLIKCVCEGDAAVSTYGRAEDILLALEYAVSDSVDIKVGYRILEGGADVDEVYNFALLHYVLGGLIYSF